MYRCEASDDLVVSSTYHDGIQNLKYSHLKYVKSPYL